MQLSLRSAAARILVDPVLAVVFPTRCPACQAPVPRPSRGPLCEACWRALPAHDRPVCRCGVPVAGASPCGRCRRGLSPLSGGYSLGPYDGPLKTLIHELKYRGRQRVAERLAERLCAEPGALALLAPGRVLVPVPLHPRRRLQRGFNQSQLLAAALARRAGLRLVEDALLRRRDTAPQTGLRAAERRRNVAEAFCVRRRAQVVGRSIVLVDDVQTTGATVSACARALLAAGAEEVRVLTAARAV